MTEDLHHVEIELNGRQGKVVLGGRDITPAVRSISLSADGEDLPELVLELNAFITEARGEFTPRLYLPDEVRGALIALGWTPPENEDPS